MFQVIKLSSAKYLFLFFLLFFTLPNFLYSQSFDEEFLDSLPDEVREDLMKQVDKKNESEEEQYRRESTFIDKDDDDEDEELRFGFEFFSKIQTTLMPLNEPSFDGDYVLDFGDVLDIQLTGQESSTYQLLIKRDGSISFPEVGKIFLSGLTLNNAEELIANKVSTSYIGVKSFVTLSSVRDIQVIISGEVLNPGPYSLNGNSNVFHALTIAGGPSEEGTFREINLIRDGKIIESIDLYDVLIYGRSGFGPRLRSGDLIFVKPVLNLVTVLGGVKRPNVYELKEDENLSTAIGFANGVSAKANLDSINLIRIEDGKVTRKNLGDISILETEIAFDSDRLIIDEYDFREVEIEGAVRNPGKYLVNEGEGILALVNRAGGYSKSAYPFGGILENAQTKRINRNAVDELYKTFLDELFSVSQASQSRQDSSNLIFLLDELKNLPISGRVIAEFDLSTLRLSPEQDIFLQEGDKVIIPEFVNQVYIYGEVASEGTVKFDDAEDLNYYINKKGGFTSLADKNGVFILNPNGETVRFERNVFASRPRDISIYPGSVIFVPRKLNNGFLITETAQAYAAILGNIGVSLASISVLKE